MQTSQQFSHGLHDLPLRLDVTPPGPRNQPVEFPVQLRPLDGLHQKKPAPLRFDHRKGSRHRNPPRHKGVSAFPRPQHAPPAKILLQRVQSPPFSIPLHAQGNAPGVVHFKNHRFRRIFQGVRRSGFIFPIEGLKNGEDLWNRQLPPCGNPDSLSPELVKLGTVSHTAFRAARLMTTAQFSLPSPYPVFQSVRQGGTGGLPIPLQKFINPLLSHERREGSHQMGQAFHAIFPAQPFSESQGIEVHQYHRGIFQDQEIPRVVIPVNPTAVVEQGRQLSRPFHEVPPPLKGKVFFPYKTVIEGNSLQVTVSQEALRDSRPFPAFQEKQRRGDGNPPFRRRKGVGQLPHTGRGKKALQHPGKFRGAERFNQDRGLQKWQTRLINGPVPVLFYDARRRLKPDTLLAQS